MQQEFKTMEPFKERRPSLKRKPPVIKQTKTSAYRILKANPLMLQDEDSIKKMGFSDSRKIPKSVDVLGVSMGNEKKTVVTQNQSKPKKNCDKNIVNDKKLPKALTNNFRKNTDVVTASKGPAKEPVRQSITSMFRNNLKSRRRSKSAEKFDAKKCYRSSTLDKPSSNISQSAEDIRKKIFVEQDLSPIREQEPKVLFKTPLAYNRRSIASFTPTSNSKSHYSFASTPAPGNLQKRLNDWLVKRGKSIGAYHHLKCFGLDKVIAESLNEVKSRENKNHSEIIKNNKNKLNGNNNIELREDIAPKICELEEKSVVSVKAQEEIEENKENFKVDNTQDNNKVFDHSENCKEFKLKKPLTSSAYELIAKDALDDLHKLIEEGYPSDQCEAWLGRIRQKYSQLEEEPLFWECLAALEQDKGNISSAVEHYRIAIIKGAEVHTIEESLDQLFEKFSLLNINPDTKQKDGKVNNRIIMDARNTFKSTIIRFAVQERILKKKGEDEKQAFVVVTPVRRSKRLSMIHSDTPGIKLCNSLKEVEMNENTKFQKNNYL